MIYQLSFELLKSEVPHLWYDLQKVLKLQGHLGDQNQVYRYILAYLEKTWETARQFCHQKFCAGVKIWDCWCQNMDLPVSKYENAGRLI